MSLMHHALVDQSLSEAHALFTTLLQDIDDNMAHWCKVITSVKLSKQSALYMQHYRCAYPCDLSMLC